MWAFAAGFGSGADEKGGRRWLVTGGADGVAAAWDLDAMACPRTFTALDQPVLALSISAGAQHVAYGGQQEMVPIDTLEPGADPSLTLKTSTPASVRESYTSRMVPIDTLEPGAALRLTPNPSTQASASTIIYPNFRAELCLHNHKSPALAVRRRSAGQSQVEYTLRSPHGGGADWPPSALINSAS